VELNTDKPQAVSTNEMLVTRLIYHRYGHLLLGYITEVVNDNQLAEQYLVEIFKELPHHINELNRPEPCNWFRLQNFAKARLAKYRHISSAKNIVSNSIQQFKSNKFLNLMSEKQQLVFCGLYYEHKTIARLAEELVQGENEVRQVLKEAFRIIRHEQQ
jgi:tRNA(Met) C34 N-acetyltransferase TmcA